MEIRFGVVVTLKEINGIIRIDEFSRNCSLNEWLVNQVDMSIENVILQGFVVQKVVNITIYQVINVARLIFKTNK